MFNNNSWQTQQLALILQSQFEQAQLQQLQQQQFQFQQQLQMHNGAFQMESIAVGGSSCEDDDDDDDNDERRTLYVANLDELVTEELLYELFLQAGPLDEVRIPKDNSGRRRTFGFVVYSHLCSVPYALQLFEGLSLFRKTLTIKPKSNNGNANGSLSKKRRADSAPGWNNGPSPVGNPFKIQAISPDQGMIPQPRRLDERERERERDRDRRHQHSGDRQRRNQHYQSGSSRRAKRDTYSRR